MLLKDSKGGHKMERNSELEKMLIKFYNVQAGCSLRADGENNMLAAAMAIDKAKGDVVSVKTHIRSWVSGHQEDGSKMSARFIECMEDFCSTKSDELKAQVPQQTAQVTETQVNYSMGMLEQAVVQLIANMNSKQIEDKIMSSVEDRVNNFIKQEYGTIERRIVTIVDGKKAEMKGVQHDQFENVLKFVANNEPVYLVGPAGSGKNVICKQVAEALGLDFYFTNAVTQEYKLTGFTDANGHFHETSFYKAFKNGGLFMLDEMDASIPEVLIILNAAIANRYFDFPAPIGYVQAHPNFRVIAAGNTLGHGADIKYVGRNQIDGASLDRFGYLEIDYSEAIENNVAGGDKELVKFCRAFRKSASKAGLDVIVSYRAIGRLAKMCQILTIETALKSCLIKGIEKDDINLIINGMHDNSKYFDALKKVMEEM